MGTMLPSFDLSYFSERLHDFECMHEAFSKTPVGFMTRGLSGELCKWLLLSRVAHSLRRGFVEAASAAL